MKRERWTGDFVCIHTQRLAEKAGKRGFACSQGSGKADRQAHRLLKFVKDHLAEVVSKFLSLLDVIHQAGERFFIRVFHQMPSVCCERRFRIAVEEESFRYSASETSWQRLISFAGRFMSVKD